MLLLGDSHGTVAAKTFEGVALARKARLVTGAISGCPPFLATLVVEAGRLDQSCADQLETSLDKLDGQQIDGAIIEAQWILHSSGNRPIGADVGLDDHDSFIAAMHQTLDRLRQLGAKRTLIIAPIPFLKLSAPDCLLRADRTVSSRDICSITKRAFAEQRAEVMAWLAEALTGQADAMLVDPAFAFCDDNWCRPYRSGTIYYTDNSHLGHAGEEALYTQTVAGFDWLFGSKP